MNNNAENQDAPPPAETLEMAALVPLFLEAAADKMEELLSILELQAKIQLARNFMQAGPAGTIFDAAGFEKAWEYFTEPQQTDPTETATSQ